jgi:hypothetical protein
MREHDLQYCRILILLLSGIVVGAVTGFRVFNRKR